MPAHDEETLKFYAESAPTYAASGKGGTSRHLGPFLAELSAGARILELGCGGGRDAQAMLAAGHSVEPTDGSPAIARKAEELLPIPVRVMRFEELDSREAYDAVWASASLLHVPRHELPAILAKIRAALKPGGLHHASFKAGGGEGRDRNGRYFNYLTRDELIAAYRASGDWEVLSTSEYIGGGFDRGQGPWVAIMVRRPG